MIRPPSHHPTHHPTDRGADDRFSVVGVWPCYFIALLLCSSAADLARTTAFYRDIFGLTAIRKVGAPIVTRSGAPVKFGSKGQFLSIVVTDPDGYGVEALQVPPAADSPAAGNIPGASMGLTVGDRFCHDLPGFELTGKMEFSSDKATLDAMGAPDTAQFRRIGGNVPGTKAHIGFYEFSGVPRTPFRLRVPDPGCPAIRNIFADDPDGFKIELYQVSQ